MNAVNKMRVALAGYKTYIVAAVFVLFGVMGYYLGEFNAEAAALFVLNGLGFSALRAGVSK